eukprot:CAMPEP_0177594270 /NCGR_PEP_ID=MMETSP0419_2-20121207/9692_1 /TAXON_ID=582737 /ORGANISM="Tetraselmis sp., Strain GSL018" /LENGTH=283 /DNA_ID=CAMNT_0019085569 /DNA_START=77 /DNA_END=925 /DNA_ORIENTATION=+
MSTKLISCLFVACFCFHLGASTRHLYSVNETSYVSEPDPSSAVTPQNSTIDVAAQVTNGTRVTSGYEYVVSIFSYGSLRCGGWVYRPNIIVTAANCVQNSGVMARTRTLSVFAKRYDLSADYGVDQSFSVESIATHPGYDSNTKEYDVALLKLDRDIEVNPAKLITADIEEELTRDSELTVIGWGVDAPNSAVLPGFLQKGTVSWEPLTDCQDKYPKEIVSSSMVCTRATSSQDACVGDGGGPLLFEQRVGEARVVGIVSWGQGCATPGKPGVYASMAAARPW